MQHPRHHRRRKSPSVKVSSCALLLLSSTQWQCCVDAVLDVPAQLHQLQQQSSDSGSYDAPQVVLTNVPNTLFQRLADKSVRWDSLSGYLQRALLWDTGLVMTSGGRLVQIYLPCGEPMSTILTTYEAFAKNIYCPLETCHSTGLYFAGSTCSRTTVWKAAQCGIHASEKNATDIVDAQSSTLWSEDDNLATVPDVRLYKHVLDKSSGSNGIEEVVGSGSFGNYTIETDVLFTVNQIEPLPCTTESCPADSFFVAPCVQFHHPDEMAENPWCLPNRGGFVDLWIDSEISGESMLSGSSATSASAFSNTTSTSISSDTIILVVLFILLAAAVGALVAVQVYRKKRNKNNNLESSPTIFESATTTRSKRRTDGTRNGLDSRRNSLSESRRRRSIELATFCDDAKMTSKRIAYDSLTFYKLIARGANGEVWRGTCGSQIVAIKQLLPEKRHDESNVMLFSNEVRLASALEHPNIVRFVGLSWNRVCDLCIVSEFMEQGDLSVLLNSKRKDELSWDKEKLRIATDIAEALAYLHGRQPIIIHRDLKSLNVLLDNRLRAKLSDFGLSRERSSDDTMTNGVGTLLWTAPEILRGEAYSEKADVYSYAIVLSELDTCLPPFTLNAEVSERRLTTMQLMHLATSGEVSPKLRDDCPASLQQLTAACASFEPSQRPNALEIVFTLRNIARNLKVDAAKSA